MCNNIAVQDGTHGQKLKILCKIVFFSDMQILNIARYLFSMRMYNICDFKTIYTQEQSRLFLNTVVYR